MKTNIQFYLAALLLILGSLFTACDPDTTSLDVIGMVSGSCKRTNLRFEDSQKYNEKMGYATLKAPVENYHVYVCTDTHVTTERRKWEKFIATYRADLLCPVAIHLGDLIDAQNHFDYMYEALSLIPNNPFKNDTLMAVAGNHDIYFNQWDEYLHYWKTSTFYFVVETPSGAKDFFICFDSADGTIGSTQLQWLTETLEWAKNEDFRHRVACTHTSFYKRDSSQGHTSNYPLEESLALQNLMEKNDIDMVWTGHDHSREVTEFRSLTSIIVDTMRESNKHSCYMLVSMGDKIDYDFVAIK